MTTPDYRKMADLIAYPPAGVGRTPMEISIMIETALATTHSKAYREGWNEAVEECASYCESFPFPAELERPCGCIPNTEYANIIRTLRKPEGMA